MVYYPRAIVLLDANFYDYGGGGGDSKHSIVVIPKSLSVNVNAYQMADTCRCNIRYEDFPIDPRLIKSARVSVLIFDAKGNKTLTSAEIQAKSSDAIFLGFVDTLSITMENSDRMVSMEARDYTSLFIDTNFDNASLPNEQGRRTRKISLARPVSSILTDLISNVPGASAIQVEDRTGGTLKNFRSAVNGFSLLNGTTSSNNQFFYAEQNQTYWDVIVSIAESAGLIIYIELDKLVITNSRVLYERSGLTQNKETIPLIWGQNVMKFEFHRYLGKKRRFNLRLRSFSKRDGKVINVSIPREATKAWSDRVGIPLATQQVSEIDSNGATMRKPAPGFVFSFYERTREELVELGEKIFEEFIRQQLEGMLETKEMTLVSENGVETDVTNIRIGSAVKVEILSEDLRKILRITEDGQLISKGQRVSYLESRGYPPNLIQWMTEIADSTGKLRPLFYVRGTTFNFDSNGFKMNIDFVNFISLGETINGRLTSG